MRWPFARHTGTPSLGTPSIGTQSISTSSTGSDGPATTVEPPRAEILSRLVDDGVTPSRREWATLPPLQVAGGRPISLTAATRAFTESLATRQVLVRSPRLEHVRQMDAPSGSFRGVLAPSTADHGAAAPELHEPSPLPAVEHRQVGAVATERHDGHAVSPVDQLLAIGQPEARGPAPTPSDVIVAPRPDADDEPRESGGPTTRRRAGLADSRRQGLGPAYHGPLPEAMRAERERGGPLTTESVSSDMRATMRDVLGVDVGDRLVHRGPAVSAEARAMGAQAFTRDGQVHIADEVGPLDTPTGRATLAHELTHAAQQIVRGALPDEGSTTGRALEAHAQHVEQFVRGDGGAPKPTPELLHARPPATESSEAEVVASTRQMMRELVDSGLARPDGSGGIVFTMPPSSMTGSAGTQRLTTSAPAAQPGAAARHENWNGLESFGQTLAQGLGSDLLGMAGSAFGFSDEFMGEQRTALATQNREFERDQTRRAYTELRMEHLRTAALQQFNDESHLLGHGRVDSLDETTTTAIQHQVEEEVDTRMSLLRAQTERALRQLNESRAERQEAALEEVPDESYDTAFHRLFDHPEVETLPTDDELLTALMRAPATTGGPGTRPRGGTGPTPHPGGTPTPTGTPTGGPASHLATTAAGTGTATGTGTGPHTPGAPGTGTAHGTPTPHGTGTGTGTGAAHPDEQWRTADTMHGRFEGLGNALAGDIAHAELGFFGSVLGFDQHFEQSLHQQVTPEHAAAATAPAAHGGTDTAHPAAAHAGAHPDAAHAAGAHGAAATPSSTAALQTVESIVGDPYSLDELANRIYPNIRTRLRQELLIDRERAGLLADFR